jgi:hypothetical protein
VAPYLYEASSFSTTIALHCEVAMHHHCVGDLGFDPLGVAFIPACAQGIGAQ